jgi:hypothetical protein
MALSLSAIAARLSGKNIMPTSSKQSLNVSRIERIFAAAAR